MTQAGTLGPNLPGGRRKLLNLSNRMCHIWISWIAKPSRLPLHTGARVWLQEHQTCQQPSDDGGRRFHSLVV